MTSIDAERVSNLTGQVVENLLSRAGALITNSPQVRETGVFEGNDPITGETVTITFDEEDVLKGVIVHLADPKRNLVFKADGGVEMTFRRGGSIDLFSYGEINPALSPKRRRQAIGYIATAGALVDDLIDASQKPASFED